MLESLEYAEELSEKLGPAIDPDTQETILWEMQRLMLFTLLDACAEFFQRQDVDFRQTMARLTETLLRKYGAVLESLDVEAEEVEASRLQTQARIAEYDRALRSGQNNARAVQFSRVAAKNFFGPTITKALFEQFGEEVVPELGVYALYGTQLKAFRKQFAALALTNGEGAHVR